MIEVLDALAPFASIFVAMLVGAALGGLTMFAVKWGVPQLIGFFKRIVAERDWRANEARDRYWDGPDW